MFTPRLHPRGDHGRFVPVGYSIRGGKRTRVGKYLVGSGVVGGARSQARRVQAQVRLSDKAGYYKTPMSHEVSHWASGSRRRVRHDIYTRVAYRMVPALRGTKKVPTIGRVRRRRAAPRRKR